MTEKDKAQAAAFWDEHHWSTCPIDYWASNPTVQSYINRRTTGDPNLRWMDWLARNFVPQTLERGLCLACGAGTAELHAIGIDLCRSMDACDISEGSLNAARATARERAFDSRIRYYRCDLNQEELPPSHYEIVLSSGGLHHIENLEHLLDQIEKSLLPGGLLAVDEYIGPARLQYTDQQLAAVNRVIDALPQALRTGRRAMRPDLKFMLREDPSEAVRAPELIRLIQERFEILAERTYGGTLLNVLFGSGAVDTRRLLPGPQQEGAASHADLVPLILLIEELLNESGVLTDDYAVIVARRR